MAAVAAYLLNSVMEEAVSPSPPPFFFSPLSGLWAGCTYVNSFSVQTHAVLTQRLLLGKGKSSSQKIRLWI